MPQQKNINVSQIVSQYLCLSCGACSAICKHESITYQETVGGYLFPIVDENTCIYCGLCYEVCPGIHFDKTLVDQIPDDPFVGSIISYQVGKATSETIYKNSQSGGIATALLAHLFETAKISAAIVATMTTTTPPRADVILVRSVSELFAAQKSKYLPIPMVSAVSQINPSEGPVAFVGLPCHMHGLYNLIDKTPHLKSKIYIKIGLICDRIQTDAVVDYLGYNAGIQSITTLVFRDKSKDSYPGNPVVTSEIGKEVVLDKSLRMEIKDFFTPPRCRLCFDKLNVYADVVLGDPHGLMEIDRIHGESVVISRTIKGEKEISSAEKSGVIDIRTADLDHLIKGQGIIKKRMDWSRYMNAWQKLGKKLPDYPLKIQELTLISNGDGDEDKKYKANLLLGIHLDNYSSRIAVVKAAERWLLKRKRGRLFKTVASIPERSINRLLMKIWG